MAETPAETPRERWTVLKLDELNHLVKRKLNQLDGDVRKVRADMKGLADGRRYLSKCPVISDGLRWGESWTDGRIDDLHCTASNGVTRVHADIHELRSEVGALTGKPTTRLPCRAWTASAAVPLNRPWTDGRLDDFNRRVVADFAQLECDIHEIQSQVEGLRNCRRARWQARLDTCKWALAGGTYGVAIAFLLSRAAHGS